MIKTHWLKIYTPEELPKKFELVFQSWDSANKSSELSDFSVCTTWGLREKKLYLLHVFRKRLDYPDLRRAVKQQAELYAATNVVIEDKALGTQLIQDLQADGVHGATRYEPQMDKVMRMHSVSSTIENGFVYVPVEADWLPEYLHEISAFPKGKYDDQVDSTSQALDWSKQGMECLGFIELLKEEAAKMGDPDTCPIKRGGERDAGKRNSDQQTRTLTDSRSCESCNRVMSQRIPGGLRCAQCGAQWLNPATRPDVHHPTRKDLFSPVVFGMPNLGRSSR